MGNVTSRVAWKFRGAGIHKHGGDCRMGDENSVVYFFFNFCMDQSASRKRNELKIQPREQNGTKKVEFHFLEMI